MSKSEQLLEAGAWLPVKTKADEETIETLSARRYTHAALPGRTIVQIAAERTGIAEDRALDVFGFQLEGTSEPLGIRRRRPMDFAGWALVTDPNHAAYALNLVKRMKKAARKARSKPGHAWDAYTEMAVELDRSVCHFLPAFWEEVGITYRQIGNETYAGRSLSKAMQAERVHALPVDMKRRSDMVLEFALSGCLTVKALGDFAKDLQSLVEPDQAYEMFSDLAVRRTWGGLPPWNDCATLLKRLAKAAEVKPDDALLDFIRQVIEAPSMEKAPLTFWKQVKNPVATLLAESSHYAQRLLDLRTGVELNTWGSSQKDEDAWLDLLDEWQILSHVWDTSVDDSRRPENGPGEWLGRLLRGSVRSMPDRLWEMLDKTSSELASGKTGPLVLCKAGGSRWRNHLNVDVVEYCLQNKVPIQELEDHYQFNLDAWAAKSDSSHPRSVDPLLISQSEKFGPLLRKGVSGHAGKPEFQPAAFRNPVMNGLFREWLDEKIAGLDNRAIPGMVSRVKHLRKSTTGETFAAHPDAFETLKAVDLAVCLHRNLQFGIIDEYGWPVFEETWDRLNTEKKVPRVATQFPWVLIYNSSKIVAIDHRQVVAEHEFRVPADHRIEAVAWVPDQFAVFYRNPKNWSNPTYYWSDDPAKKFHEDMFQRHEGAFMVQVADGWMTYGGVVRAGQHPLPTIGSMWNQDGRFWAYRRVSDHERWMHEIDPTGDRPPRKSMPPFLTDEMPTSGKVNSNVSYLTSVPEGLTDSPLGIGKATGKGTGNGMLGWVRWYVKDKKHYVARGIDGRTVTDCHDELAGLLDQPGTDQHWHYCHNTGYHGGARLMSEDGIAMSANRDESDEYRSGQVKLLPPQFMNYYRVRDLEASKKLRKISLPTCQKLLQAAVRDATESEKMRRAATSKETNVWTGDETEMALMEEFGENLPARLMKGLTRIIRLAGDWSFNHQQMTETHDPVASRKAVEFSEKDQRLRRAFSDLRAVGMRCSADKPSLSTHLEFVIGFINGEMESGAMPHCDIAWHNGLSGLPKKIWDLYWARFREDIEAKDLPMLPAFQEWAKHPIHELPGRWRVYSLTPIKTYLPPETPICWKQDDICYFRYETGNYTKTSVIVAHSKSGEFQPPDVAGSGMKYRDPKLGWTATQLLENLELMKTNPWPLPEKDELEQQAANMQLTSAEALSMWVGMRTFETSGNRQAAAFRKRYGLKQTNFKTAASALSVISGDQRSQMVKQPIEKGIDVFFAQDRSAAWQRIADTYNKISEGQLKLSADVMAGLTFISATMKDDHLTAAGNPEHPIWSNRATKVASKKRNYYGNQLSFVGNGKNVSLSGGFVRSQIGLALLINYETEIDDPVRLRIADILATVKQAVLHPETVISLTSQWINTPKDETRDLPLEKLESTVGPMTEETEVARIADSGMMIGAANDKQMLIGFRPAKIDNRKTMEHLWHTGLATLTEYERPGKFDFVCLLDQLLFDQLGQLPADIEKEVGISEQIESDAEQRWPHDPRQSVPQVVEKLAKHLKLDEDSATLYLQMLALPDPTQRNICKWNGWTTGRYKKVVEPLEKKELVFQAKRARAGRSYFLPGGWQPLAKPNLPIELWKLELYDRGIQSDVAPGLFVPYGRILPWFSFTKLFEKAWLRIKNGETPQYEEVRKK